MIVLGMLAAFDVRRQCGKPVTEAVAERAKGGERMARDETG